MIKSIIIGILLTVPALLIYFKMVRDPHAGSQRRHSNDVTFVCNECGAAQSMTPRQYHERHDFEELEKISKPGDNSVYANCNSCDGKFTSVLRMGSESHQTASFADEQAFDQAIGRPAPASAPQPRTGRQSFEQATAGQDRQSGRGFASRPAAVRGSQATPSSAGGGTAAVAPSSANNAVGKSRGAKRGELNFKCTACGHGFSSNPQQLANMMAAAKRTGNEDELASRRVPCPSCRAPFGAQLVGEQK